MIYIYIHIFEKKLFVNQGHFGILTPILPNSKPSFQWRHSEVVIIYPWYIQSYQWLISENLLSTGNALISEKLCKVSREQSVYQHEKRWHYPVKCCLMYSMGGNAKKRRSKKGETCITGSEKIQMNKIWQDAWRNSNILAQGCDVRMYLDMNI
jgi:hypothetical protein